MNKGFKDRITCLPVPCGMAAGLLVSLLCMTVFTLYMGWSHLQRMSEVQGAAISMVQAVAADTRTLLERLNRSYQPDCSDANLQKFREEVFASAFQGEVGVLDEQGRLICTSLMGRLPRALEVPVPDLSGSSMSGEVININNDVTLLIGGGRFRATIVRMGRFNTVVSPKSLETLFSKGQDSLRLLRPEGDSVLLFVNPALSAQWKKRLAQDDLMAAPVHEFSWRDLAFISSRPAEGTRFISQSITPLQAFFEKYDDEFAMALLASLLTGVLAYAAVVPVFRSWNQLGHRIKGLLIDDNIICMYQPIVELMSGVPVGCEVLMRLRDGAEVIYPDQVLPLVVQRKLTWELDQAVVRKAIRELSEGLPAMAEFKVAFNFFPENISYERLSALFDGELKKAQPRGFKFDLEVIEQQYEGVMLQEITELKRAGYLVSVDDFGTGYSNLGSVKTLSPDLLKIDKSFVFEMEDASVRSSLVPEIVGIARAVGAKVIAEGIENEAQRRMLLGFGVDFGQGYLFARPMDILSLARFLQAAPRASNNFE
jgi:sensor c-di-GMP phosphodiesterase-like protein